MTSSHHCHSIAEAAESRGEIIVRNPKLDEKEAPKSFTFDAVFGDNCTQKQVSSSSSSNRRRRTTTNRRVPCPHPLCDEFFSHHSNRCMRHVQRQW